MRVRVRVREKGGWDECCCGVGGVGSKHLCEDDDKVGGDLGCEMFVLAGNHKGHRYNPEAFAVDFDDFEGVGGVRERMGR